LAKINIGHIKPNSKNKIAIVFDIEVSSTVNEIKLDEMYINEKLESYHNNINKIFKNCISEKLKEEFGVG
jgi:uncharacterized protein (TIGR04255 family)